MKNAVRIARATFAASTLLCLSAAAHADDATGIVSFRQGRFAEAYQTWHAAFEAGDGRAARLIGVMYDAGEGVTQNRERALDWYRRAAELGDPAGMLNVAILYDSGNGLPRNRVEAARWYSRAARLHEGRAEYDLALMYTDGDGVARDPVEARRLFAAAARDGISAGAVRISNRIRVTRAEPAPDAVDVAFVAAQRALLSRDPQQTADAANLFRVAAHGTGPAAALAQYDLAWCYENGIGTSPDRGQAYRWYLRAAAQTDDPGLRAMSEAGALALHTSVQMQMATLRSR